MNELAFYAKQSVFTDPGMHASIWDKVEPTIPAMRAAITPLLFHYRGDGDFIQNGIDPERISEVDLRYADDMLDRIEDLQLIEPGADRLPENRIVGCCRDWALLFVSLARHHGFSARSRVGFAKYFAEDWWIDHTIAEIWDDSQQRWRLVDPELRDSWSLNSGELVDPVDISPDIFLPGLDAWQSVRQGERAADRFVVAPEIEDPNLRGIPYLWHNVVQDLAALNRHEMILWDVWGIDLDEVNDQGALLLDAAAGSSTLEQWREVFSSNEFGVPETVLSFSPYQPVPPKKIELRSE